MTATATAEIIQARPWSVRRPDETWTSLRELGQMLELSSSLSKNEPVALSSLRLELRGDEIDVAIAGRRGALEPTHFAFGQVVGFSSFLDSRGAWHSPGAGWCRSAPARLVVDAVNAGLELRAGEAWITYVPATIDRRGTLRAAQKRIPTTRRDASVVRDVLSVTQAGRAALVDASSSDRDLWIYLDLDRVGVELENGIRARLGVAIGNAELSTAKVTLEPIAFLSGAGPSLLRLSLRHTAPILSKSGPAYHANRLERDVVTGKTTAIAISDFAIAIAAAREPFYEWIRRATDQEANALGNEDFAERIDREWNRPVARRAIALAESRANGRPTRLDVILAGLESATEIPWNDERLAIERRISSSLTGGR